MLNVLLLALVAALAGLLAYAATRPDTFRVERAVTIEAPPDRIYPWLDDLRASEQWSPYFRKDPAMKKVYGGPDSGVGATCEFDGNREVGAGRLTIVGTVPLRKVELRLEMRAPMQADNRVEYRLVPRPDGQTEVTWAMQGAQNFLGKLVSLVFDIDSMVGRDFAAGLANLKAIVEGRAEVASDDVPRSRGPVGATQAI